MGKVSAIAKLTAQDGKRDELVSALGALVDGVGDEPGTLIYSMHTDNAQENVIWFFELYGDDTALKAHSEGTAMKKVGPSLAGLVAAPPEIHVLTPIGAKGIEL